VELSAEAVKLTPLLPDEQILEVWRTRKIGVARDWQVFCLTTQRILIFRHLISGLMSKSEQWELLAARRLEDIEEPRVHEVRGPRNRRMVVLDIAGFTTSAREFAWTGDITAQANARTIEIEDRIVKQRSICLQRAAGSAPSVREPAGPRVVQQIVTREIIKVPCDYCKSLVDVVNGRCGSCGATLTVS
jgi:hypothetical protein